MWTRYVSCLQALTLIIITLALARYSIYVPSAATPCMHQVSLVALNLLADPLDSLHLTAGEEVGVSGSLPSHVTHYVNRNTNKDVS